MDSPLIRRRQAIGLLAGTLAGVAWGAEDTDAGTVRNLAIGNYGMKSLSVHDAIRTTAEIGFDGFEWCAISGWNSSPEQIGKADRRDLRSLLMKLQLRLVAMMEDLPPSQDMAKHSAQLERIRSTWELARDLVPEWRPMLQTVLGGGAWDDVKTMFRDRVGEWLKLAEEHDAVVCIKPHRFGAMSTPEQAVWIIDQLGNSERLRIVFDFSHYAFREISPDESIAQGKKMFGYVAMKDAKRNGDQVVFDLPGQTGEIDHAALIQGLRHGGYNGDFCCEVSGQVSSQTGYDPITAARVCFANLSPYFRAPSPK